MSNDRHLCGIAIFFMIDINHIICGSLCLNSGFMDVEAMYPDNFQNFDDWAKKKTQIDHNMEYVAYKAVEFIEDNVNNDFFLFVNPTAPHAPDIFTAMSKDCRNTVDGNFTEIMDHGWSVEGMTKEFGDDCFAYRDNAKERAGQSTKPKDLGSICENVLRCNVRINCIFLRGYNFRSIPL